MSLHKCQSGWGMRTSCFRELEPGQGGLQGELCGYLKEAFLEGKGLEHSLLRARLIRGREGSPDGWAWQGPVPRWVTTL